MKSGDLVSFDTENFIKFVAIGYSRTVIKLFKIVSTLNGITIEFITAFYYLKI